MSEDVFSKVADAIGSIQEGRGSLMAAAEAAIAAYNDYNDRALGVMIYKGNSVSWWHSKAENYKAAIGRAWDALIEEGYCPDGHTALADAIRSALNAPESPARTNPDFKTVLKTADEPSGEPQ